MRIVVVGGGPGGLYFATLAKRFRPADQVVVVERNGPDDAYGLGVVFSEQAVRRLEASDAGTYEALRARAATWDGIEVRHRGRSMWAGGHRFWAITRRRLLDVLRKGAAKEGVELCFRQDVTDLAALPPHDLLVGADGVNSVVREAFADRFRPSVLRGRSNYIWLGATKPFPSFAFVFEEDGAGCFGAHVYPVDVGLSTFIVDADDGALRRAGIAPGESASLPPGRSDEASIAYLQEVFAPDLDGHRLVGNNSRWLKFREIRNAAWQHDGVVLLGDAAHTAHPSVGSGTKLALEDGMELSAALRDHADVEAALRSYEERRRPQVERTQRAAEAGGAWWDWFRGPMRFSTPQFVAHYMTRTPRVGVGELRVRDERLVRELYEGWAGPAMGAPLDLAGLALPNRLAVPAGPEQAVEAAGLGAGLVVTQRCKIGDAAATVDAWAPVVDAIRSSTPAAAGVRLEASGLEDDAWVGPVARAGFSLVELAGPADHRRFAESCAAVRARLPRGVVLAAAITYHPAREFDPDPVLDACAALRAHDVEVVSLGAARPAQELHGEERRWRHQALGGLVRAEVGMRVLLDGGVADDDEAETAVLAGRADVCVGHPRPSKGRWQPDL
ncbi:MAG: FAD-dependent monooxygenase [Carbonactinosporaceae bacterium]